MRSRKIDNLEIRGVEMAWSTRTVQARHRDRAICAGPEGIERTPRAKHIIRHKSDRQRSGHLRYARAELKDKKDARCAREAFKVDIGDGARTLDTVVVLGVPVVIFSLGCAVSLFYTTTFSKIVLLTVTTP